MSDFSSCIIGQYSVKGCLEHNLRQINNPSMTTAPVLFYGPSGTGKTTTARKFYMKLCDSYNKYYSWTVDTINLTEVNAAQDNGVDFVRALESTLSKRAVYQVHCYIIDEAHMLTQPAWNALLKLLEELPPHTYIFFCTTSIDKIPDTILSRLTKFKFNSLTHEEMRSALKLHRKFSDPTAYYRPEVDELIKLSNGNVREMLNTHDKLIRTKGEYNVDDVREAFGSTLGSMELIDTLYTCVTEKDDYETAIIMEKCRNEFNNVADFFKVCHEYLAKVLMNKSEGAMDVPKQIAHLVAKEVMLEGQNNWELVTSLFILDANEVSYYG